MIDRLDDESVELDHRFLCVELQLGGLPRMLLRLRLKMSDVSIGSLIFMSPSGFFFLLEEDRTPIVHHSTRKTGVPVCQIIDLG